MITPRYISSFAIIDKLFRDSGLTIEIKYSDVIEWIAEALDHIAAPAQYINDIQCIEIDNYKGKLPCNFQYMKEAAAIWANGSLIPMRYSTHSFHPVDKPTEPSINDTINYNIMNTSIFDYSNYVNLNAPITFDSNGNPVVQYNEYSWSFSKDRFNLFTPLPKLVTYKINDDYIFTSFRTGKVMIAFDGYPVDKDGFPLIPDDIKYKAAVTSYVMMKIDYLLWRKGEITRDIFNKSETEWEFYVGAAQNKSRIPNVDKMESWFRNVHTLIPRTTAHNKFFRTLNS